MLHLADRLVYRSLTMREKTFHFEKHEVIRQLHIAQMPGSLGLSAFLHR